MKKMKINTKKEKMNVYKEEIKKNLIKSNDILIKILWSFVAVVGLMIIPAKLNIFRVSEKAIYIWFGISTLFAFVVIVMRKLKVSEDIIKYYIISAINISVGIGAGEGRIGLYCTFLLPCIVSLAYMDIKCTSISCLISFFVYEVSLYMVSDYRQAQFYKEYTRIEWFKQFSMNYMLEFLVIVVLFYFVAARYENIVNSLNEQNRRVVNMQKDILVGFSGLVESRDSYTGKHIVRTAKIVRLLLDSMKENSIYEGQITEREAEIIENIAPLHDVGKIRIPDRILCKPGKLTAEEYELIKKHTIEGNMIIEKYIEGMEEEDFIVKAKEIALCHHERWDGMGYPNRLKGEEIPISARVMAVADVFDALICKRCYKEAMTFDESYDILVKGSGTQFDPEIIRAFEIKKSEIKKLYSNMYLN